MTGRLITCVTLVALLDPRVTMAQQPAPPRGLGIGAIAGRQVLALPQVRSCAQARSAIADNLSFAPPTRIDFEDIVASGQANLTNQYASRGVTLNGPVVLDLSRTTQSNSWARPKSTSSYLSKSTRSR